MAGLGERAVVLGASMGGLLAARVLADFYDTVTVVERDVLADDPAVRRGVPQGRHLHVLLARGGQILDELFPGFLNELVADGAPVWNDGELSKLHLAFGGHEILRSGKIASQPKALAVHMPSRPFLEFQVRRRLQAIGNVTILAGHDVTELTSTPDRGRVTGVRVVNRDGGAERELTADVVMDAMGRGAHTPAFLESLGYGRPVEDHIVMHTNYVSQLLRMPQGTLKEMLVDIGPAPGRPAGMFLTGYEDDTWMFTVFGMAGHQPPRDLAGMLSFAQEYCPAHLIAAIRAAEPIGEVAHHHMPSSQWRRYDKMAPLPDGLLVCGDAICSVNPVYGQGMTLAALEAATLRECLRGGGTDLPRRYFRASAKPIGVAWQMVASSDLTFPGVAGRRSRSMRVITRLVDWALAACESDLVVAVRFFKVNGLIDSPIRLLHPGFVFRVAVVNLRRRRFDGLPRQAKITGRADSRKA
jgi:2-polyprenyl-6-methoxyphenol hydroxylase-like FAD-dependent oxidoreductase